MEVPAVEVFAPFLGSRVIYPGPPTMGPPKMVSGTHIFSDSCGSGMGIVWEAYHKGVPVLGVPENPIDGKSLTNTP